MLVSADVELVLRELAESFANFCTFTVEAPAYIGYSATDSRGSQLVLNRMERRLA